MNAITPPGALDPVEQWERNVGVQWPLPDAATIAAGDEYIALAVRRWAAAGLSNWQIDERLRSFAPEPPPEIERVDAAIAFARHCAMAGVTPRQLVVWLTKLAFAVPCWSPNKPNDIAKLVTVSLAEVCR